MNYRSLIHLHMIRGKKKKSKQPILVVGSEAQNANMIEEETRIKVVLSVHDENIEKPWVEIGLQVSKWDSSLANLVDSNVEDSE